MTEAADTPTESVDIPEDYAAFKDVFNGTEKPAEAKEADTEEDTLATEEVTDADEESDEVDAPEEGSDDEDESEDEPEDKPEPENKGKKPKPSARERINELTREKYEERRAREERERENAELRRRLEALEKNTREPEEVEHQPQIRDSLPQGAPNPDAVNKDGSPVYPLGEYDPKFIMDLTQFTVEQKTSELEKNRQARLEAQQAAAEKQVVIDKYHERLEAYESEVPEVREHLADLVDTFAHIEPTYGDYLATTIMECDNGPAIMDYLSQNIGEAQGIVASGPAAAAKAIFRLDVRLAKEEPKEQPKPKTKTSESAPPPPKATRGSSQGKPVVRPDTDDYEAFKREFLKSL